MIHFLHLVFRFIGNCGNQKRNGVKDKEVYVVFEGFGYISAGEKRPRVVGVNECVLVSWGGRGRRQQLTGAGPRSQRGLESPGAEVGRCSLKDEGDRQGDKHGPLSTLWSELF